MSKVIDLKSRRAGNKERPAMDLTEYSLRDVMDESGGFYVATIVDAGSLRSVLFNSETGESDSSIFPVITLQKSSGEESAVILLLDVLRTKSAEDIIDSVLVVRYDQNGKINLATILSKEEVAKITRDPPCP